MRLKMWVLGWMLGVSAVLGGHLPDARGLPCKSPHLVALTGPKDKLHKYLFRIQHKCPSSFGGQESTLTIRPITAPLTPTPQDQRSGGSFVCF
ncbi:hypothetical protein LEMLEM_LOCUS13995 [Lemmus lemmus]